MNHIPCNKSTVWRNVCVPFLCQEWYDGLGFTDFPLRKGYQEPGSDALELGQHSWAEKSAFLQSWLYFGMLEEVLGFRVIKQDFIHEGNVDSSCLLQYILEWYNRVLAMSDEQRQESHLRAQRCLTKVRSLCMTLLDEEKDGCPLIPEVLLSIRILGESLSQAKHSIWWSILGRNPIEYIDARGKWGSSKLVAKQLMERGWCPNEVAFLQNYPPGSPNAGAYYASYLHRPHMGLHGQCSASRCAVGNVDVDTYQTKHCDTIAPACDGKCLHIQPSLKAIHTILAQGTIPLLYASFSSSGLNVEVVAYEAGMEYTAISHIWSDGLGNQKHNWIPSCQFVFLIRAINTALEASHGTKIQDQEGRLMAKTALFWIDTVCIPRADVDRKYRHMALNRMVTTYQDSKMVLVLDAELYRTPLPSTLEATVRVLCSNWMRRLWTLQEGILGARKLQVLFENTVLDLWKGLEELNDERRRAPWICHPIVSFATRTGIQQSARSRESKRTSWLFSDVNWRSTSRPTDEALLLTNLFELDIPNIMQIPAKDRMKKVISMMETFPQRIIFAPGPRFEEDGFRWALKSFSNPSSFSLSSTAGKLQTSYSSRLGHPCLSLVFSYPGYIINAMSTSDIPSNFTVIDAEIKKCMIVTKRYGSMGQAPLSEVDISENIKVLASKTNVESPVALILHRLPLADTDHVYGAVVRLDQLDAGNRNYDTLSGTHEGAFDVSACETPSESFALTVPFDLRRRLVQQRWSVR